MKIKKLISATLFSFLTISFISCSSLAFTSCKKKEQIVLDYNISKKNYDYQSNTLNLFASNKTSKQFKFFVKNVPWNDIKFEFSNEIDRSKAVVNFDNNNISIYTSDALGTDEQFIFDFNLKATSKSKKVSTSINCHLAILNATDISTVFKQEKLLNKKNWRADYLGDDLKDLCYDDVSDKFIFDSHTLSYKDVTSTSFTIYADYYSSQYRYIGEIPIDSTYVYRAILSNTEGTHEDVYIYDITTDKTLCSPGDMVYSDVTKGSFYKSQFDKISLQVIDMYSIGDFFLYGFSSLQTIDTNDKENTLIIPKSVQAIHDYFLYDCPKLTSYVDFSQATSLLSIGNNFMFNDLNYNQPINLSNTPLISIGSYFLGSFYDDMAFNSEIIFDNVLHTISGAFLFNCRQYNKDVHLVNSIQSIDAIDFMFNCQNYTQGILYVETDQNPFVAYSLDDNTCFESSDDQALIWTKGFNISVVQYNVKVALQAMFPNTKLAPGGGPEKLPCRNINWL